MPRHELEENQEVKRLWMEMFAEYIESDLTDIKLHKKPFRFHLKHPEQLKEIATTEAKLMMDDFIRDQKNFTRDVTYTEISMPEPNESIYVKQGFYSDANFKNITHIILFYSMQKKRIIMYRIESMNHK